MTTRLVVVGASLAGLRAVEAARNNGYSGEITLIGSEPHLPYDRPPLSKKYLTDGIGADYFRSEDALVRELGIDLRLGTTATGLDPVARTVLTTAGIVAYDTAIIATGAAPRTIPGVPDLEGIVTLRTLDDADRLRGLIRPETRVLILGAGFIGSEIASSAKALGADAVIVEAAPVPLVRAVGDVVGRALAGIHARYGTRLLLSTTVEEYLGDDRIRAVTLSTGEEIPADVVVIGIGAAPATAWLKGSGVALHPVDGGLLCDAYLRTSLPGVYAAGDVVHWPNAALDTVMRLENWTSAAEQAARAGVNAVDEENARPFVTVPYFWSDWYDQRIQFIGTATAGSVSFVSGGPDDERFVALYRTGDRLVGAATLNERRTIMKLRRLVAERGTYDDALALIDATEADYNRRKTTTA